MPETSRCYFCKDPPADGKTMCERHLALRHEQGKRSRLKRKQHGLCLACGRHHPADGLTVCGSCHKKRLAYHEKRRHVARDQFLKRVYGITLKEYEAMRRVQGNLCAICGKKETSRQSTGKSVNAKPRSKIRALSVDHDHRTKEVRGLLCATCNRAIVVVDLHGLEILERIKTYFLGGET